MIIAIDFDGTCVTHEYPLIGRNIGASDVLKKIVDAGHFLILFTMRSGKELEDSVAWFETNGIPLYGIQTNPTQHAWTTSHKAYAQLYIDDAALGCPLTQDRVPHPDPSYKGETIAIGRPYVDWTSVEIELKKQGILK